MVERMAVPVAQEQDRLAQQAHADGAGKADNRRDPEPGAGFLCHVGHVLPGQARGDGGHQVGGHGHGQRCRNVDHGDDHAAVHGIADAGFLLKHAGVFHQAGQHEGVNDGGQRDDAGAEGDRDRDQNDPFCQGPAGRDLFIGSSRYRFDEPAADDHIQHGDAFRQGGPQQRAGAALDPAAAGKADGGEGKGDGDLADLLDQLADRRRQHIAHALHISAVGAHGADEEQGRSNADVAEPALRHALRGGDRAGKKQEQDSDDNTQDGQELQRSAEDLARVARLAEGDIVGHHTGNGDRDAGGRNGQQKIVRRENLLVQVHSQQGNGIVQRDPVQDTDHLAYESCDTEDRNTADQAALLFRHNVSFHTEPRPAPGSRSLYHILQKMENREKDPQKHCESCNREENMLI